MCSQLKKTTTKRRLKRRPFLFLTSLVLLYPLLSFLGFKTPKKPKTIRLQLELKPGEFHIEPDFVLFTSQDNSWAVSRKCTHLGCIIQFREQERIFECPCHTSRFSDHGVVLNGPAKRNLSLYKVEKQVNQNTYLVIM